MKERILKRLRRPAHFGTLRRTSPISQRWGYDRGTPVDRYYIERFLAAHSNDIRGRVLEVMDDRYTDRFGTDVSASDILDIAADNPRATLVADLGRPETMPDGRYDCLVMTQTLQFVFDLPAAVESVRRLLRPGGVVLVTVPSISRLDGSAGPDGEFWRFTPAACARLFETGFDQVEAVGFGNVLTGAAFLFGLAHQELSSEELEQHDRAFPVVVALRAVRSAAVGEKDGSSGR